MYLSDKPVMMVGSVSCDSAEEVFSLVGPEIGKELAGISHGEPGYRNMWVVFNAPFVYEPNPDIEITNKPKPDRDKTLFKGDLPDWLPTSWEEMWRCKVKDGVDKIHFDSLGYADFAIECYRDFCRLREQGVIPQGLRYQVNFPFPEDFTRWCTGASRDFAIMTDAIVEVLGREVTQVVNNIPHADLSIQWDVCWEVFACDQDDCMGRDPMAWKAEGDPYERLAAYMSALCPQVPEDVVMGMHLCYGDLEHSHLIEPKDLGVCVEMTNVAVANAGRRFDYVQMPVPKNRDDDAYFEPLQNARFPETKLYIGLVHFSDGYEGAMKRLKVFRKYYTGDYGVATECGWGRRPKETLKDLMALHKKLADDIRENP